MGQKQLKKQAFLAGIEIGATPASAPHQLTQQ
jgi:hypothetical protein